MRDYQDHPMLYAVSQIIDVYTVENLPPEDGEEALAEFEKYEEVRWLEKNLTTNGYCELCRLAYQVFIHKYGCTDNSPVKASN